ncbi:hypothetical protein [Flavitalea sp.]|nr:hypothetical protein [Flavitalea sp.]
MCKATLDYLETALKIVALVSAAGFFGWKIIAGWLIVNLEISIETTRQAIDDTNDLLAIKLLLKKGNTDALWLKDIAIKVQDTEGNMEVKHIIRFDEYKSLSINKASQIVWGSNIKSRKFTIAPGEVFHFAKIEKVSFDKPLIIEAAVFGKRAFWWKGFQWRASVASLLIEKRSVPENTQGK